MLMGTFYMVKAFKIHVKQGNRYVETHHAASSANYLKIFD